MNRMIMKTMCVISGVAFVMVINGMVLAKLWSWFISPVFGVPLLTVPQAAGIHLIVLFFWVSRSGKSSEKRDMVELTVEGCLLVVIKGGFALGLGWLVNLVI